MTWAYAIGFIVGVNIGFFAACWLSSGKITDMQKMINTMCDSCAYRLLNHPQRERVGSITRR